MLTDHPGPDVVEVSIFGPGKGESILVHLGQDNWIIVDSCIDQTNEEIPALLYLDNIGVDVAKSVKLVIATHAHDDHISGISKVFDACPSAVFVCSQAVTSEEFFSTVEVDDEIARILRKSSYSEYRRIFDLVEKRGRSHDGTKYMKRALESLELLRITEGNNLVARVTSLSPSHEAVTRSLRILSQGLAKEGNRRKLSTADPNEFAIALWIEAGMRTILLGADLLKGPTGCGWDAILATFKPGPDDRAAIFKIPHHGAPNAHHEGVWSDLLIDSPVALLAPFRAGVSPRPTKIDRERICTLTKNAYISASPDLPAQSKPIKKTAAIMSQVAKNVRDPYGKAGQVRARANTDDDGWKIDLVPPARRLCS